ncbi:origin recognition complex subunit 1 [Lissotriton helveticus]
MSKYFTRVRRRRHYSWAGAALHDRKLHTMHYGRLFMSSEENPKGNYISNGDYILVEGDDPDRPYVAKLLDLYDDGSCTQSRKHAVVQWFARFEEVPRTKQKRLGREVHPQEIFLYDVPACDNDIDAETIVGTVQVQMLHPNANLQVKKVGEKELFAMLSWNGKTFQPLTCALTPEGKQKMEKSPGNRTACPPKLRVSPEDGAVDIICAVEVESGRVSHSSMKKRGLEIESKHSASKYSHSKDRIAQRGTCVGGTPGARKKLQLCSPAKSPGSKLTKQDVLEQLFDDNNGSFLTLEPETFKRKVAFSGLSDSPEKKRSDWGDIQQLSLGPLKPSKDSSLEKSNILTPIKQTKDCDPSAKNQVQADGGTNSCLKLESKMENEGKRDRSCKTPQKQAATLRNNSTPLKRETPSRRCSVLSAKKAEILKEEKEEPRKTTDSPRSCRKSAQLSSLRSRQQLKFLGRSDNTGEDEDFQPLKETVESSSSEESEEEEDQEGESKPIATAKRKPTAVPRTPVSSKKASLRTPAKTPSKSPAPRTPKTPRLATPRIPERNKPARNPSNVLEEARVRLHVSAVPDSLPCREQEYQDIYSFVESKLLDGTGGCMYISGVPGTGKTATVHEVIRCLQHAADDDDLPSFQYIEINGMKLTEPHQAYVQILKLLTGQKATADHAAALLEKRFSTPAPKRETTVLIVDELDLLWTRKQNVMYNLFDWPTRKQAKLIVLAIANTMDLPERIMMNRVASRLGLTRMSFQPYAYKQLQQIITSRLNHVKAFKDDAIQLVARKVAALSGDARRCLDICRRATEICEFSDKKNGLSLVGMQHVMEALEEMFSSPYVIAIRNSSVLEQCFLRAVLSEFRRSGLEETLFQQVYHQLVALCRIEGLPPPTMSEAMAVCLRLGACRLLLVEPSKNDLLLRVRLNVSQDDIMYALKVE